MIKAEVIADSKNEFGNRITTMLVTFPRYILAELNTHRMFSKNSSSSRAIPFERMLTTVENTPFVPMAWMENHKGMQGDSYITDPEKIQELEDEWHYAKNSAIENAQSLFDKGVTKQIVNRLLEPFMYHTVLITATEWENFFYLRCPRYQDEFTHRKEDGTLETKTHYYRSKKDFLNGTGKQYLEPLSINWLERNKGQADIHMMALAEAMWDARNESTPVQLEAGQWHIPFEDRMSNIDILDEVNIDGKFDDDLDYQDKLIQDAKLKISTAMCARTSYTVIGEEHKIPNVAKDIQLANRLSLSGHWSPFEHCAKAMEVSEMLNYLNGKVEIGNIDEGELQIFVETSDPESSKVVGWSGNFKGFIQYRKTFEGENKI